MSDSEKKTERKSTRNKQQIKKLVRQYQLDNDLAQQVVEKRCSLLEALEISRKRAERKALIEKHQLQGQLLTEVISGILSLDDALIAKNYKQHLADTDANPTLKNGFRGTFWLHQLQEVQGEVVAETQYDIQLGEGDKSIPKLDIKAFAPFEQRPPLFWNESLKKPTDPTIRIEERFRIAGKQLYAFCYHQTDLEIELAEGLCIQGRLQRVGRYECEIRCPDQRVMILMRHALVRIQPI